MADSVRLSSQSEGPASQSLSARWRQNRTSQEGNHSSSGVRRMKLGSKDNWPAQALTMRVFGGPPAPKPRVSDTGSSESGGGDYRGEGEGAQTSATARSVEENPSPHSSAPSSVSRSARKGNAPGPLAAALGVSGGTKARAPWDNLKQTGPATSATSTTDTRNALSHASSGSGDQGGLFGTPSRFFSSASRATSRAGEELSGHARKVACSQGDMGGSKPSLPGQSMQHQSSTLSTASDSGAAAGGSSSQHGVPRPPFFRPSSIASFGAGGSERGTSVGCAESGASAASPPRNMSSSKKEFFRSAGSTRADARGAGAGAKDAKAGKGRFLQGKMASKLRGAISDHRRAARDAAASAVVEAGALERAVVELDPSVADEEESREKELDHALFNCFAFVPIEVVCRLQNGLFSDATAPAPTHHGAYVSEIECAVLFSDVSGFTQLTERLQREKGGEAGAEMLNDILNHFFEQLITTVHEHDGDVIKFAGDAVLSIWSSTSGESIEDLVAMASACALEQLRLLDHYQGGFDTTLRLHLGLGAGRGIGIDVGNRQRREFVVAGPPLDEMSCAEGIAGHGEVVIGPTVWELLEEGKRKPEGTEVTDPEVVARDGKGFRRLTRLGNFTPPPLLASGTPRGEWVHQMQSKLLSRRGEALLDSLRVYTAGPVRHHLHASSLQYSTEFREATMMFVRITRLRLNSTDSVGKLQQAVLAIMNAAGKYEGTITRISIDDKGTVTKITFGLPPFLHTDDPTRAVLCGMAIRDAMRQLRLKACIGVTTGHVFIGCVGAEHRCEYTEYGDKVNMAARYMSNATNEVYCDEETYSKCAKMIDWDVLKPIKVKGKDEPVPVFRPFAQLEPYEMELEQEENDEKQTPNPNDSERRSSAVARASEFVGRVQEVHAIVEALLAITGAEGLAPPLEPDDAEEEPARNKAELARQRTVVVVGDAGLGKSRLVEEAQKRLLSFRAEAVILASRGSSTESSTLLYPWKAIFRRIFDIPNTGPRTDDQGGENERAAVAMRGRVAELLPVEYVEHASLLNPVLGLSMWHTPATLAMADDVKAEAINSMLVHVLSTVSRRAPTVIVMEDVHFFDSASWTLLLAIAALSDSAGTAAAATGEADSGDEVTELPSADAAPGATAAGQSGAPKRGSNSISLSAQGACALLVTSQAMSGVGLPPDLVTILNQETSLHVSLGPMSPAELVRIARNQLGARSLSQKAAKLLGTKSAGSPFFCLELVKLLKDQGLLTVQEGVVHINTDGKGGEKIPDSVEQAIVSRIDRLGRKYLMALKCASVAGNDFVDEMLKHMLPEVGISKSEVPSILGELVGMGLLVPCENSKFYTHSFKSALVRDVVYERLPFQQRRGLHTAVAQWIEEQYQEQLPSFYPVLAHHWQRAELDGEAVRYFELCAEVALKQYANHEAVSFLNEVLTIVHKCTPDERVELGVTVEKHAGYAAALADAALRIGQVAEAMEALEELLEVVNMPLPLGSAARKRAILAIELAWANMPLGIRSKTPRALRSAPPSQLSCELTAFGYQMASRAFYFMGDVLAHDIATLRGLDVAARVGGAQLARSLSSAALAHGRTGSIVTALRLQKEALAICELLPEAAEEERNRREPTTLYCMMMKGMLCSVELCEWAAACEAFQLTMDKALELGMWRRFEESANQKALVLMCQGELEEAQTLLTQAARSAEGRKDVQMYALLAVTRVAALLMLGRHSAVQTATAELERLEGRLESTGSVPLIVSMHGCVAMAKLLCANDLLAALASAEISLLEMRRIRMPSQFLLFFAYSHIAHVFVEAFGREPNATNQQLAAEAVGQLELFASRFRAATPRFLLYRGGIAWLLDRRYEALKMWGEAVRLAHKFKLPYDVARIEWEIAKRTCDSPNDPKVEAAGHTLASFGVDMGANHIGAAIAGAPHLNQHIRRPRKKSYDGNGTPLASPGPASPVAGERGVLRRPRMGTSSLANPGGLRRGRMQTDEVVAAEQDTDRFEYSVSTAALDWAKSGPGREDADEPVEEEPPHEPLQLHHGAAKHDKKMSGDWAAKSGDFSNWVFGRSRREPSARTRMSRAMQPVDESPEAEDRLGGGGGGGGGIARGRKASRLADINEGGGSSPPHPGSGQLARRRLNSRLAFGGGGGNNSGDLAADAAAAVEGGGGLTRGRKQSRLAEISQGGGAAGGAPRRKSSRAGMEGGGDTLPLPPGSVGGGGAASAALGASAGGGLTRARKVSGLRRSHADPDTTGVHRRNERRPTRQLFNPRDTADSPDTTRVVGAISGDWKVSVQEVLGGPSARSSRTSDEQGDGMNVEALDDGDGAQGTPFSTPRSPSVKLGMGAIGEERDDDASEHDAEGSSRGSTPGPALGLKRSGRR